MTVQTNIKVKHLPVALLVVAVSSSPSSLSSSSSSSMTCRHSILLHKFEKNSCSVCALGVSEYIFQFGCCILLIQQCNRVVLHFQPYPSRSFLFLYALIFDLKFIFISVGLCFSGTFAESHFDAIFFVFDCSLSILYATLERYAI